MKFGFIGIRSKHYSFFRSALEALSEEPVQVLVWGQDAPGLLPGIREAEICSDMAQLICRSDAVLVTLREGTQHLYPALLALDMGKPVFVDKPFTCSPDQARQLALHPHARLCTGGSTICYTEEVRRLQACLPQRDAYRICYQADPFDPYGGWYFYGSHAADLCTAIFGTDFQKVTGCISGDQIEARVFYPQYTVTLRTSPRLQAPVVCCPEPHILDDQGCYRQGMAHFLRVIRKKEDGQVLRLAASVRLMDELINSIRCSDP